MPASLERSIDSSLDEPWLGESKAEDVAFNVTEVQETRHEEGSMVQAEEGGTTLGDSEEQVISASVEVSLVEDREPELLLVAVPCTELARSEEGRVEKAEEEVLVVEISLVEDRERLIDIIPCADDPSTVRS